MKIVATAETPSTTIFQVKQFLLSDVGLLSCIGFAALIALFFLENKGGAKGKLARARFAGSREKTVARKLACKQITARKLHEAALYIGSPRGKRIHSTNGKKVIALPEDPKTIYIPYAGEHILIIGRPGSGKTYSAGDPLVRSAIDQGHSIFYYDLKGHEEPAPSSKLLGYAKDAGYKISIFAPGSPETCVCNPLDFLSDSNDAEMAYQLAAVLNQNFKLDDTSGSSGFFTQTGNQLVQAILMLAKGTQYPDLAMCHKILALPELIQRLLIADLEPYLKVSFDNFLSSAGSPETAASIATTASLLFTKFMTPQVLPAFCGKTTLPFDVEGRQFVVFRMDPKKRSVVGPLLAATIHLMVNHNIFRPRRTPLIFSGDEISSIDLIMLADWLNQLRSSGFVGILGTQALGFLEATYGENRVNGILSGSTTQIIFQLNDNKTAEYYTHQLGNEDIHYKQKSRSYGAGGASHSLANHQQTRPLVEIQQIQQLPKGKCLILNPGYGDKKEIRIPLLQQIKIPDHDLAAMKKSVSMWPRIKAELIKSSTAQPLPGTALEIREAMAYSLLPQPGERLKAQQLKSIY